MSHPALKMPVPVPARGSAEKIVAWLRSKVPCSDNLPKATMRFNRHSLTMILVGRSGIDPKVAQAAANMYFGPLTVINVKRDHLVSNKAATIGPSRSRSQELRGTLPWLEQRYQGADLGSSSSEMNDVLEALVRMLIRWSGGTDEEWEAIKAEVEAAAPSLYREVRHLTRSELRAMRYAPTPDIVRRTRSHGQSRTRTTARRGK